jgi:hypothetical protein
MLEEESKEKYWHKNIQKIVKENICNLNIQIVA